MIAEAAYDTQDVVRMRDSSGSTFSISEIENKKMVIFDDATTSSKIPIDLWVTLPEGGHDKSIQGERKYQEAKSILVEQPLIVTTNVGLPHNKDAQRMDRRYVIIPFLNQARSRNDALREKLLKYYKGNFMVHCWMLYQNELKPLISTKDNFQNFVEELDNKHGNKRYSLAQTMCLEQDENAAMIIKAVMALNKEDSTGQRVLDIYPNKSMTWDDVYISLTHLQYLVIKYYVEIETSKPPELDAKSFQKFQERFKLGYRNPGDFNNSSRWPPLPCTESEKIRDMDSATIFLCGIGIHKTLVNYKAQPIDSNKAIHDFKSNNKSSGHNSNNYNNNNGMDYDYEQTAKFWISPDFDGIAYFGTEDFFYEKIQFSFLNNDGGKVLKSFRFNKQDITKRLKNIRENFNVCYDHHLQSIDPFAMSFIRAISGSRAIFNSNHELTNLEPILSDENVDVSQCPLIDGLKIKQVLYDNEVPSLSLVTPL